MDLAAVTVLYNPTKDVMNNINSYIDSVGILYAIDNSDNDNSELFKHEKIKYIPNMKNVGVSVALNAGADMAISDGYDWLLTMDQDSCFQEKNSIENMKSFLFFAKSDSCVPRMFGIESEKIGILSPFHLTSIFKGDMPKGYAFSDIVMTSGNIVSLSALKEIGGYNNDYFIDAVDFDFCLNMRNHGYDIICLNYVHLNHELGDPVFKTILGKSMYSFNHNYIRCYYIVRNRLYFYDAYKDKFTDFCKAEKKRTSREAIKILLLENDKFRKLRNMYRGYKDYKRGVKGAIPERFK